jgi:hypothetical protein
MILMCFLRHLSEREAFALVDKGDTERYQKDVWDNPISSSGTDRKERSNAARVSGGARGDDGNTLFGAVFQFVTSKYMLYSVVLILTIKYFWPTLKNIL